MGYREPTELEQIELFAMGPAGIDVQEKRGQAEFVQNEELPIDGSETKEAKKSPIKWGKKVNDLFREATLPPGWKKVPTSHSMWSDLRDSKGCHRASIFYKAAFYDERATIHFNRRYYYTKEYDRANSEKVTYVVYDCGQGPEKVAIYSETPDLPNSEKSPQEHFKADHDALHKAMVWMKDRYPDADDPNAYWDPA